MKVNYTTINKRLSVEIEGETQKDVFKGLATFQEVFEESTCGECGFDNLRFVVRTNKDDDEYYELRCMRCFARLAFGQNKKGGSLFPKRKDNEGKLIGKRGWFKWNPLQNPPENLKGE